MTKLLLYCTKTKPRLFKSSNKNIFYHSESNLDFLSDYERENILNGKIVAECECDKVEEIVYNGWWNCYADNDSIEGNYFDNDLACLSVEELENYLKYKNGYALHLSNVKVFDEPLSLNECENYFCEELKQAPQNMMNVKLGLDNYVLISIQPQHLAKILNGEKTIEVRKKILNSLKEML